MGIIVTGVAALAICYLLYGMRLERLATRQKRALLSENDGRRVTILRGSRGLFAFTGVLEAPAPIHDHVELHTDGGGVEPIFVGDIQQVRDDAGDVIGQW
jgi:hypothetical protein